VYGNGVIRAKHNAKHHPQSEAKNGDIDVAIKGYVGLNNSCGGVYMKQNLLIARYTIDITFAAAYKAPLSICLSKI
jgi:hypothetical protein